MSVRRRSPGQHRADAGRHRSPRRTVRAPFLAAAVTLAVVAGGAGYVVADEADSSAAADTPDEGPAGPSPSARVHRVAPGFEITRESHPLPNGSGTGRRVVFSEGQQRVWLVAADGAVSSTHPVSGSRFDNLFPGTYEVFSRSRHATAFDHSSTMGYFVRFTHGTGGAAIGFHDIPVDGGDPVQSHDQLGTPLSAGCIRQRRADAIAVWEFAPVGTTVVVTS